MRSDKETALRLRLRGHSYTEIQRKLGVPKSTLSGWFSGTVLSSKAQARIAARSREGSLRGLLKKNKAQTHEARQRAHQMRSHALQDIGRLSRRELLLAGTLLYWGEGYKKPLERNGRILTSHIIALSNTDPELIKLFVKFLKDIVKIPNENIRASVHIYNHINEEEALEYWHNITKIPLENFEKTYYGISKSSEHKRPYNRLPFGTLQVRVGDTKNFHRIMGWIEGIKRSLKSWV